MKKNNMIALGGIITALCTSFNILAAIVPTMGYVFPAFAGILILIIVIEGGYSWAGITYFSSSILSLLLCADKFPAFAFISLLGFYPMVKLKIDSLKIRINFIKTLIKLLVFNLAIIINFYADMKIFGVPEESMDIFGIYFPYVIFVFANITFFMYNKCINNFIIFYINVIRKRLRKIMSL